MFFVPKRYISHFKIAINYYFKTNTNLQKLQSNELYTLTTTYFRYQLPQTFAPCWVGEILCFCSVSEEWSIIVFYFWSRTTLWKFIHSRLTVSNMKEKSQNKKLNERYLKPGIGTEEQQRTENAKNIRFQRTSKKKKRTTRFSNWRTKKQEQWK